MYDNAYKCFLTQNFIQEELNRGNWVAQWLSAFGSGRDSRVLGSSPASGSP